jgi:hypothetical protein
LPHTYIESVERSDRSIPIDNIELLALALGACACLPATALMTELRPRISCAIAV